MVHTLRDWTRAKCPPPASPKRTHRTHSSRDNLGPLLSGRSAPSQDSEHGSAMKTLVMTDHHSGHISRGLLLQSVPRGDGSWTTLHLRAGDGIQKMPNRGSQRSHLESRSDAGTSGDEMFRTTRWTAEVRNEESCCQENLDQQGDTERRKRVNESQYVPSRHE